MKIKNINHKSLTALFSALFLCLVSCVDDRLDVSSSTYNPADDPEMVCLPFNINLGVTASTRDGDKAAEETEPGFVDGSATDHKIDFDSPHECFAIFFDMDKKVKYIKDLYLIDQLGSGDKVEETYPEFSVPVVCYIPKSDCEETLEGDSNLPDEEKTKVWTPKLLSVLVVLNGGTIYNKLHDEIYNEDGTVKNLTVSDILSITWKNPAKYSGNQSEWNKDAEGSWGRIGFNSNELFTMTNSAYWKKNEDDTYKLMTATPIEGKAYSSIKDYLEKGSEPTSTVYVERMVSKFSAPTFQTEVIGSDRVFRPDQNAMAMVIYSWEGDNLVSSPRSWRIHLLGWAINGDESESYIFKNIGNVNLPAGLDPDAVAERYIVNNIRWPGWNDETHFRTYWSVDPHYTSDGTTYTYNFYPWQFRKAADRSDIISIQGGLSQKGGTQRTPVLRYNTFNEVLNEWSWRSVLHIHENTFDPDGDWYDIYKDNNTSTIDEDRDRNLKYLDGRASILAGPHLLIVGEVYVEDEGNDYSSAGVSFGTVTDLYSDRVRRFYKDEKDWFKMFVREFNRALATQERMNFSVLDWDETSDNKASHTYTAEPEGEPVLYFGNQPLTNDLIDNLAKQGYTFSQIANVRNGDGRLIPWIEPKAGDNRSISVRLMADGKVREDKTQKKKGDELFYTTDNIGDDGKWIADMYKSMFYEWFGPIDHFKNGYMYYAGPIRHNQSKGTNMHDYYGTVRNHWYKFHVESINAMGIPVDDPDQLIIPGSYNYNDQIIVFLDVISWHSRETIVDIE